MSLVKLKGSQPWNQVAINLINAMAAAVDSLSGGGVSDGDKGEIIVSGGGTVWTIDGTVLHPKIMSRVSLRF